jgi:hypothetical protein
MADETSMALEELLRKAQLSDDVDFLREGMRMLAQALVEVEVTQHVGASRFERTPERTGERTGTRERRWETWRYAGGQSHLEGPAGARRQLLSASLGAAARRAGAGSGGAGSVKRMCTASRRGGWTSWCRHWVCMGSARVRSRWSARNSRARSSACAAARWVRRCIPTSGWMPPPSRRA